MLYTDDLVVIAETEYYLITRLNEWKDNMENRGMRVRKENEVALQRAEMRMVRWMCGIKL